MPAKTKSPSPSSGPCSLSPLRPIAPRLPSATAALNICSDWYDLDPALTAVAVGDVVGHGLGAAGIMGQLHAALNAAIRATWNPVLAVEALEEYAATDPPLGVGLEPVTRSQATVRYTPGSVLALYTDGLVERRGENIDTGLRRLAGSLVRHRHLVAGPLADGVLADLGAARGNGHDDTALVIVRL